MHLSNAYIAVLLTAFLLYPGSSSQTITLEKWRLYLWLTGAYVAAILLLRLELTIVGVEPVPTLNRVLQMLPLSHKLLLGYLLATVLSAILSDYRATAIWGSGRCEGLVAIALYVLSFMLVSVYAEPKRWMLWLFAAAVSVNCVICLIQFAGHNSFYLYPEGMNYYDANKGTTAPNGNRDSQTNNGNLITEAMRWKAFSEGNIGVDDSKVVAVTNGGGIRAAIKVGDVTRRDLNKVLPFGNTVAVVYVTGAELLEALEASTYCTPSKLGGYPQTSPGICWTLNTLEAYDANDEPYPESVYYGPASIRRVTIESINGKPFNVTDTYVVVTNNFCASGGDTYYAFHRAYEEKAGFDTGILLDDAVCEYIETELKGVISEKYATDRGDLTMITADTVTASGTMGDNDELSWSYRGYKRQLTVAGDEIGTDKPLYIAEYADSGKMLGVTVITGKNATISTKDKAKEVKLMWLDKDGVPLCRFESIQ